MPIRPFVYGIFALSSIAAQGQWVLNPINATILSESDGIRVALLVDLYMGCPAFSHVLYEENDTMRLQACYYTTVPGNMAGCWRYDTVDVNLAQMSGCQLMVDFNEIGTFYTVEAIDTLWVESRGPYAICSVGLTEMNEEPFRLGPNPFMDQLVIEADIAANHAIEIFHPSGRTVYRDQRSLGKGSNVIDLPEMASGLYVIRISGSGRTWHRSLVKQ